jgi:hypothetical protein
VSLFSAKMLDSRFVLLSYYSILLCIVHVCVSVASPHAEAIEGACEPPVHLHLITLLISEQFLDIS